MPMSKGNSYEKQYCWQCTEEKFGVHGSRNGFAGIHSRPDGMMVICAGCGSTVINHRGKCFGICDRVNHVDLKGCLLVSETTEEFSAVTSLVR